MITVRAQEAFTDIFDLAMEEPLRQNGNFEQWTIQSCDMRESTNLREFIILTMCSYSFRLFFTMHFTYHRRTLEYVAETLNIPPSEVTRDKFYDCLSETANIFCGSFKRTLGKVFPHLSMSTPDVLNEHSFAFFENLKYEFGVQKVAQSVKNTSLFFGIYVCPFGDLDFEAPPSLKEEETQGELELF